MIKCENLVKIYKNSEIEVIALQGLDLLVEKGEFMAIIGNSGSGKSTLLNMLGGLDKPSAGKLLVNDLELSKLNDHEMYKYKQDVVGFVWQNNARNLIPYLSAIENVEIPLLFSEKTHRRARALELLEKVGLSNRRHSKIGQLSGGELQRVAISIALANSPKLLLADEPTGSVDSKTASQIFDLFRDLNRTMGITIVIVTHDNQLSKKVDRVVAIRDGKNSSEFIRKKTYADELAEIARGQLTDSNRDTHVEMAVMDKVGRLQVPVEYLKAVGLEGKNKVMVTVENNRIVLFAPE